jgi:hypothetical protein
MTRETATPTRHLLSAVLLCACFQMQSAGAAEAKAKPDPRGINGSWSRLDTASRSDLTINSAAQIPIPTPPLKPQYMKAWEARQKEIADANARGEPLATNYTHCIPDGMPAMMMAMFPMEVLQSPGRVTIVQEAYNQVRRIYLDEQQIPVEDAEPRFWGHSVARWEGNTLVVDTVGIKENVKFRDVPHSNQMRISERIRLTGADGSTMENQIVVTDPVYLTAPWSWTWNYQRLPDYKLYEYVCEDNREYADPETGATRLRVKPRQ